MCIVGIVGHVRGGSWGGLTCNLCVGTRLLLAPRRDEHGDGGVSSEQEIVDSQQDALAGKRFLITVTEKKQKERGNY